MNNEISAIVPASQNVANIMRIFALKKVQQTQKETVLALLDSASTRSPSPGPSLPYLGNNVDVRV
ncbi:MAG: hypothetical protein M1343_10525 [Chloroflexi bacterium]|nr:hypothetical protein [Chloroflexota bacterium]MDA8187904.1 hypothetical protein [Dehalococcoidales bacterium]